MQIFMYQWFGVDPEFETGIFICPSLMRSKLDLSYLSSTAITTQRGRQKKRFCWKKLPPLEFILDFAGYYFIILPSKALDKAWTRKPT